MVLQMMTLFEKEQVQKAFQRCFGLKETLHSEDSLVKRAAITSLAYQSGLREEFIKNNLEEILKL